MPQSLAHVLIHLVWSTRLLKPWITDDIRDRFHAYTLSVLKNLDCPSLEMNSEPDHVHILCVLARTVTVAKLVEKTKTSTSGWFKTLGPPWSEFYWQGGYGAFSVSQSQVETVRDYIRGQHGHHRKQTFQDELRALLQRHGMAFDERYVWE